MSKAVVKGIKGKKQLYHAVYDFSKDGGVAASPIDLFTLKAGTILHNFWLEVEEAVTSTGSATVEVGLTGGDTDGIMVQMAKALLVADYVSKDADKGAILHDATDDYAIKKKYSADQVISMLIGTEALTAGKIHFYAECSDGY